MRLRFLVVPVVAATALAGCSSDTYRSPVAQPALENGAPFGAVAFSQSTEKWQIVSDLPGRSVARTKAISGCAAGDCIVIAEFSRGECASLSLDAAKATTAPYVSVSRDASSVMELARQACKAGGGQECKASAAICN